MGNTCKTCKACINDLIGRDEIQMEKPIVELNKKEEKENYIEEEKQENEIKNIDKDNLIYLSLNMNSIETENFNLNNKDKEEENQNNNNIESINDIIFSANKVEVKEEKNLLQNSKENEDEDEDEKKSDNQDNKSLTLNFYDEQGNKNYPLKINLSNSKKFYLVIGKLYEEYPEFEDKNIKNYIFKNKNIKRRQKIEDLGLEDSCKINIQFF